MTEVEISNTTYLTNSRPFIVSTDGETSDGRHIQGLGISFLTRSRATNKAISNAEKLADETSCSFEILNVDYRGTSVAVIDNKLEVQKGGRTFYFPPYKVRLSAVRDGKSADGSSSSFLSFSGTVESAVKSAESQLDRMS